MWEHIHQAFYFIFNKGTMLHDFEIIFCERRSAMIHEFYWELFVGIFA